MYFSSFTSIALLLSAVSALPVPRATAPKGWADNYLESYDTYHTRYVALQCQTKHNTAFFDSCCHPLLATESLASRPAQCSPSGAAQASATVNTSVDSDTDDDDGDCDEDDEDTTSAPVASSTSAPVASSAPAPVVSSASAPVVPSTHAAATTQPATTTKPQATTKAAPTTAAQATPTHATSSSAVQSGGFATFFYQNGVAGACGTVHKDTDLIAAIDADRYGNTGARSSLCGKQVQITNTKNGKSVTVTIADACPTCENSNSIDLSKTAFERIATDEEGMVPITWSFL
ncbi:RlpA-like double-psi beta-barrel-protein domain-containing protein-containing protein [Cyathus striatus]|nr:RlpA-like double-psi beta-barrel-protein domain-containing protein-containing protein [Cyathus striatus]